MGLLSLVFGATQGFKYGLVLMTAVGLMSCYGLLRARGGSPASSALMALTAVMNAFLTRHASVGHVIFFCICYLPLLFLLMERSRTSMRGLVLAALVLALTFMSGGHYITPMAILGFGFFYALDSCGSRSFKPLLRWLLVCLLSAVLAGVKLLPSLELLVVGDSGSVQHLDGLGPERMLHALLNRDLATSFRYIRGALGGAWEVSLYIGPAPFLAMLVALAKWRRYWKEFLTAAFLISVAAGSFHEFAPWSLMHLVPGLSSMRVASRFMVLAIFFLAVATAPALAQLSRNRFRGLAEGVMAAAALLVLVDLTLLSHQTLATHASEGVTLPVEQATSPFRQLRARRRHMPLLLAVTENKGVVDCYANEMIGPTRVKAVGDSGYRGEVYLAADGGSVAPEFWSPNRLSYDVTVEEADTLIVNQRYYPGWKSSHGAVVDASGLLAVDLPPGRHHVELTYSPRSFYLGLLLTTLGVLFVLSVVLPRPKRLADVLRATLGEDGGHK
jgi:hypothetical protein